MMTSIAIGFNRALAVLAFLRHNPVLLVYMLIIQVYHIIILTAFSSQFLFLDLLSSALLIWLGVALIYHASSILQRQQITIVSTLSLASRKIKEIAIWGCISAGTKLLGSFLLSFFESLVTQELLAIIGIIIGSLFISFIICIIAYENATIQGTVQQAGMLIAQFPKEIIGGYGLLASFFLAPLVPLIILLILPMDASARFLEMLNSPISMLIIRIIIGLITIVAHSALILFCMSLYQQQRRNRVEDLIIDSRMTWLNS